MPYVCQAGGWGVGTTPECPSRIRHPAWQWGLRFAPVTQHRAGRRALGQSTEAAAQAGVTDAAATVGRGGGGAAVGRGGTAPARLQTASVSGDESNFPELGALLAQEARVEHPSETLQASPREAARLLRAVLMAKTAVAAKGLLPDTASAGGTPNVFNNQGLMTAVLNPHGCPPPVHTAVPSRTCDKA